MQTTTAARETHEQRVEQLLALQVELLRDLLAAVTAPSARHAATLSRADRARLGRLLPAIAGVFGLGPFVARDLTDPDLTDPKNQALVLATQGLTPAQLGRVLRRGAGVTIDGYGWSATVGN